MGEVGPTGGVSERAIARSRIKLTQLFIANVECTMHTSTRQPRGEIGVGIEFGAELVVGGEEADVADFKNSSWDRCGQSHRVTPIPRGPIRRGTPVAAKKQPLLGAWLQASWSVSETFSYQKNFPAPHSGARGRGLPTVEGASARHSLYQRPLNSGLFGSRERW